MTPWRASGPTADRGDGEAEHGVVLGGVLRAVRTPVRHPYEPGFDQVQPGQERADLLGGAEEAAAHALAHRGLRGLLARCAGLDQVVEKDVAPGRERGDQTGQDPGRV